MVHKTQRINDEIHCSCGLTWDVDEEDPHPKVRCPACQCFQELISLDRICSRCAAKAVP